MDYVELKCKTNFSFLRGASHAKEYVARAKDIGLKALAITDVNGVYSLPRAFEAIRDQYPELKLICGAELCLREHAPLTLLATSRAGYGFLCRLITALHAGKPKGEGILGLDELVLMSGQYAGFKDLICLVDVARANLEILSELFEDRLYLSLCRYEDGLDHERTQQVLQAAAEFKLPIVATNDVHYHAPERRLLQDCLTCIREGTDVDNAGFKLFGNEERHLKSAQQMRELFRDLPQAIENTVKIAQQCQFNLSELKYTYPHEFIPAGQTPRSYLRELVYKGATKVYGEIWPAKVKQQIERELNFLAERNYEHYFLTVQDIVRFANENNIICQGRGSAANSIICYVLEITSVDPIDMNLLFDRFMNESRNEPPDIDVDFEHNRREEVIQYIYKRFGRERAAMVSAVRTYRSKSSFLEISKSLGVNVGTMSGPVATFGRDLRAAKPRSRPSATELEPIFDEVAKERASRRPLVDQLVDELKSFPRHLSIHSGGFVLSNDPLVEMVPVEPARMEGRTIVQWDKDDLATLGLMKVDVLSIGFLTALHQATDLAGIHWREIPNGDLATYQMIQRAETHGTFQIESRAQMAMLVRTLPEDFYDLVVEVALVRPSPSMGGMVQPYIRGRNLQRRGVFFTSGNIKLDAILRRTCGVPIFQEQIMQISIDIAGFSSGDADQLRRSIGRERSAAGVEAMSKKLREALLNNGMTKKFADDLFEFVKGYSHYGFPESHAASYATLAYKSAYMKCHHPAELLCALINSQPMGFYTIDSLVHAAKRQGVQVLPVHPNKSGAKATIEAKNTVRMGFTGLRGLSADALEVLLAARDEKPFASMEDFVFRSQLPRAALESLSLANAFECFGVDRRHSFWHSLELAELLNEPQVQASVQPKGGVSAAKSSRRKAVPSQQLSLFNEQSEFTATTDVFEPMTMLQEITVDYRRLGYSLQGNYMKGLRAQLKNLPKITSKDLHTLKNGTTTEFAGVLTALQRPPPAKGTAFVTLEDEFGTGDLIVRNEIYEKYENVIRNSRFLLVRGKVQRRGAGLSILVQEIISFYGGVRSKPLHPRPDPRGIAAPG